MARRRVFKMKVECSALNSRTKPRPAIGQMVTLQKSASGPGIEVVWGEGTVVGSVDPAIGAQVASAIDRGQSFTATIENAYQLSGGATWIHLKVEYLLEQGQRAIEVPKLPPPELSPSEENSISSERSGRSPCYRAACRSEHFVGHSPLCGNRRRQGQVAERGVRRAAPASRRLPERGPDSAWRLGRRTDRSTCCGNSAWATIFAPFR